jgi:single-strand DNA-binding protein
MVSLNRCQFIGNLGNDPEMRYSSSGNPLTSFSLACHRFFKSAEGERREETEWINVVAWNKQAEVCNQYLTKGMTVYVEGRWHTRSWDGQGAQKHYRTEIIASRIIFLSRAADNPDPSSPLPAETAFSEEIPF